MLRGEKNWRDRLRSAGQMDWTLFYLGIGLVTLGLMMPAFLGVQNVRLYDTLYLAVRNEQEIYVLLAALELVSLNAVRAFPHYLGVFFLVESFSGLKMRYKPVASIVVVCCTIPGVYAIIERVYHIRYDFGIPAVSMIIVLIILGKIDFSFINLPKKALMVGLLITSLQFLDMMPSLWPFPFGRGESAYDIKLVSKFLNADIFLQGMSTVCFAVLFFTAVLLMMLIIDENNIHKISEQKEKNEQMLMETRMRNLENRNYMELRHLVHDLKSPLTSMQALVGVVKMSCAQKHNDQEVVLLSRAEDSIERMSGMISEILHEKQRTPITTHELLSGLMAQISAADYVDLIHVENHAPEACIKVNKIRFSRVLVNLLENAVYAVERPDGRITLEVSTVITDQGDSVRFQVRDNGRGIAADQMENIWAEGFSSHRSSGLGLVFVRQTVDQSGGTVTIESEENKGTVATVLLQEYKQEEEHHGNS